MVAIAPQTDIILLQVPLQLNQEHQLNFASATAQYNYFNSLPKLTEYNATYMRKDGVIRYEANYEDLVGYNYVMYRNEAYGDKWFYAFITNMEYVNDNMTNITIKTDVWQSWQFSFIWKDTFIEREHTNNDAIGSNTIPESLETGEYIINEVGSIAPSKIVKTQGGSVTINTEYLICFQVTAFLNSIYSRQARTYNRTFSGLGFLAVEDSASAIDLIEGYEKAKMGENIVSIFMCPKEFFQDCHAGTFTWTIRSGASVSHTVYTPAESFYGSNLTDNISVTRNDDLGGYVPKNNKLYTYPFSYLYVNNNAGSEAIYRYEDFTQNTPKFYLTGAIGQGCSIKLVPLSYKMGDGETYSYGLIAPKLPVCAWYSDYYTNWMTQNAVNIGTSIANDVINGVAGVASASMSQSPHGAINAIASTGTGIASTLAQIETAKRTPDQVHGDVNASDVDFASRKFFTWHKMSLRPEIARVVDEYFSMYGYATHRVKKPNITGRRNWNYVKTIGCYIQTNAPQEDVQELEAMFDRGITIWHNPATFMDYSQNNPIV